MALDVFSLLPFFFILAIVYGALEVSKVFENKGAKAIIALVMAFFAMLSPGVTEFILFIIPYATMFFIAFFFLGFVLSFFKSEGKDGSGGKDYTLIIIVLGLFLLFITSDYQDIVDIQDDNFVAMIVLLVIALIFLAAYRIKGTE